MITLFDIQDTDRFFSLIDHCCLPVTIQLPGRTEIDIRHNADIRHLLTCTSRDGSISRITLGVGSISDRDKMIRFMLDSHPA